MTVNFIFNYENNVYWLFMVAKTVYPELSPAVIERPHAPEGMLEIA
ncbi:MAG: hypothetical protein V4614_12040 [Pseudomonadota bacterium]